MNFKYSGLIFVLIVILDAISGARLDNTSSGSQNGGLPAGIEAPEKSQTENGTIVESIKTIKPVSSDVIPNPNTTTTTTTTTSTTTTTTTTPAPPAPSPPAPAPERGTWIIRENNKTCVIAQMAMQLNVTYPGKSQKIESAVLSIPKNATSSGSCNDPSQALTISWGPGHSIRINFRSNTTTKNFFVNAMDISVNATVLKDAIVGKNGSTWHFSNHTSEFATPLEMSYKCSREQDMKLNSTTPNVTAILSLKDTQLEAYMNKTKVEFGAGCKQKGQLKVSSIKDTQDCDSFDTPDIVPIAVGCALTVLVLVVLAAYLIGRRRSQNRGYLSM